MNIFDVESLSLKVNSNINSVINTFDNIYKIGLFYPYKNEVNVLNLINYLDENKYEFSLPRVIEKGKALKYFSYLKMNPSLKKGFGGIMEPTGKKSQYPDVILASCCAFNEEGFRVGYGGGFFDRTIMELRNKKNIKIILAAFELQKTSVQFQEYFDEKVDYICTENKTYTL